MSELATVRNTQIIAAEINSIKEQTRKTFLYNSIEIGRRLAEAKQMLPHGQWGTWLEQNVDYSQTTANNLVKIFEQYSSDQLSIFGDNIKSQAFVNLSYSQALALLGVPEEQRETFVTENDVENMSTRELKEAIEEKKRLEQKLKKSQEEAEKERLAKEKISASYEKLEKQNKKHEQLTEKLKVELAKTTDATNDDTIKKLQESLSASQNEIESFKNKIKELEDDLNKKPIEGVVVEVVPEEIEKELAELREKVKSNDNKASVKFSLCFESLVGGFKDLLGALEQVKEVDTNMHEKYKGAVNGLLNKMAERI